MGWCYRLGLLQIKTTPFSQEGEYFLLCLWISIIFMLKFHGAPLTVTPFKQWSSKHKRWAHRCSNWLLCWYQYLSQLFRAVWRHLDRVIFPQIRSHSLTHQQRLHSMESTQYFLYGNVTSTSQTAAWDDKPHTTTAYQEVSACHPLSQQKVTDLLCQTWVVSLQITSHKERNKRRHPWRNEVGLFVEWLLFHTDIWKCKISVSITTQRL